MNCEVGMSRSKFMLFSFSLWLSFAVFFEILSCRALVFVGCYSLLVFVFGISGASTLSEFMLMRCVSPILESSIPTNAGTSIYYLPGDCVLDAIEPIILGVSSMFFPSSLMIFVVASLTAWSSIPRSSFISCTPSFSTDARFLNEFDEGTSLLVSSIGPLIILICCRSAGMTIVGILLSAISFES